MSVIIVTPPNDEVLSERSNRKRPSSCKVSKFLSFSSPQQSEEASNEQTHLLKYSQSFCSPQQPPTTSHLSTKAGNGTCYWHIKAPHNSTDNCNNISPTSAAAISGQSPLFIYNSARLSTATHARRARFKHRMLSPTTQLQTSGTSQPIAGGGGGGISTTAVISPTNANNVNIAGIHPSYPTFGSFEQQTSFDSACSELPQLRRNSSQTSFCHPIRFSYSAENLQPDLSGGGSHAPGCCIRGHSPRTKRIAWDPGDGTLITDIGGITTDYMRVNGALHQFRSLLGSVREKAGSQNDTRKQRSVEEFGSQLISIKTEYPKYGSETSKQGSMDVNNITGNNADCSNSDTHSMSHSKLKLNISYRLGRRREVFDKRRKAADYSLLFALLGLFMMITENELSGAKLYDKHSIYSFALKTLIVISTIALLCFIVSYHALEVQLFLIDNCAEDWRIVLTPRRLAQLSIELLVCMICPIPGDYTFQWGTVHADGETVSKSTVSVDVLLSIPMFLRLYLIARVMLLHSRLFTDASSRSIGALNRINFNTRFVMKTLMTLSPGTMLIVMIANFWIIAAWILRLCERHHSVDIQGKNITEAMKHENYLNSIWLIAITFLSVGYGDIVPNTICGRTVAVITGIMGAGTSSLVVAVLAKKLEFSRAEKHVHNFMMDTQLTKRLKHAAANVLRETWLIYKNRKKVDKIDTSKVRYHQRKFLMAIYELRRVKAGQRKLAENSHTVADIARTSTTTYELVSDMHAWEDTLENRMQRIEEQMQTVSNQMHMLPDLIIQRLIQNQPPSPSYLSPSTKKPPSPTGSPRVS